MQTFCDADDEGSGRLSFSQLEGGDGDGGAVEEGAISDDFQDKNMALSGQRWVVRKGWFHQQQGSCNQ